MKTPLLFAALVGTAITTVVQAQKAPKMKMTTEIPPQITTPDSVETRLGTLKFFDGFPDDQTVEKVMENLDFSRGVQTFLSGLAGSSLVGIRAGLGQLGANNSTVAIFEQLLDSKALWLTANTDSIYFSTWLDLHDGPLVLETPPNVLAFLDDFWFHYIIDIGNAGPDKGAGGKFLLLPPDYKGKVPEGYFVAHSSTYGVWFAGRGFKVNGDPKPAVESIKKTLRIYPLAQKNPTPTNFINVSGIPNNTIHANNFAFYEELNQLVQEEPSESLDPETLGLFASIGIEKGKNFAPDERMKKILTEAAAVGNATARAMVFRSRQKDAYYYPDSAWCTAVYRRQLPISLTASELQTDQQFPTVGSQKEGVVANPDTSDRCLSLARWLQLVMKPIGCRPFPAKAGTSSSVSMARYSLGTTRLGVRVRSS